MVTLTKSKRGRPKKETSEYEVCRVPGCEKPAATRGICTKCYSAIKRNISRGNTTWEEVIEAGLALPAPSTHSSLIMQALNKFRNETKTKTKPQAARRKR